MIFFTRKKAALLIVASTLSASAIIPTSNLGEIGPVVLIFSGLGAFTAPLLIIALNSIKKAVQQEFKEFRKDIRTDIQDARK